jgi:dTDP-4-amino-4,6-dideoxygalactose transaminase
MTSRWQHGSNGFENERLRMPVPFNKPHVFPEGLAAIQDSCANGKLSGDGLHTKRCSQWFNDKFGYSRCLLTPSCTAALEMAALLLDLGRGDEVICPSYTFVSTANAFALRGCKIVFADSESATPNVSVEDILAKVTPRTKAICVVHYAGIAVDVQKIKDATHHKIPIVEDCAHAIGSIDPVTNQVVGKNCDFAAFSFHETKNICIGEGGLLVINDESKWKQAQIIREKGTNRIYSPRWTLAFCGVLSCTTMKLKTSDWPSGTRTIRLCMRIRCSASPIQSMRGRMPTCTTWSFTTLKS